MSDTGSRVLALVAILLAIVAIAASVTGIVYAANGSSSGTTTMRTISAQGHGSVSVKPDQAVINVGVQTKAPDVNTALSNNSTKLNAVIATLQKAGVPADHLQTSDLNMYQDSQTNNYVVTNTLAVQLDNANTAGSILTTATNAGANSSWGVSFSVKDPSAARQEAISQALTDARQRADRVAAALGLTITRVHAENEVVPAGTTLQGGGLGGGGGAPVQSGETQVTADVTVTYEVK